MAKKRGQSSGAGAAGLVAVIAGLIVLYILFLEPSEREELLDTDSDGNKISDRDSEEAEIIKILLDEEPGRLDYLKDDEFEINIPSFNLYKTTEAKEIERFNDFVVRNGWFDEKVSEKTFYIEDLENTENIILSFLAREHKGTLTIMLNDKEIFSNDLNTQNVEPIKLRTQELNEGENTIKLSVSEVGAAFWRTNEYVFEGMKIIGDITDISRQKTSNIFTVEAWKYNNLEKATLKFNPECIQSQTGLLEIEINNRGIFSGVPDCGLLNRYSVPTGALDAGVNDVVFKTSKGSYLIDQIEINLELEELSSPLYWFELTEDEMENVTKGLFDVNLTMEFIDDDEDKILDINVNGHMRRIDQEEPDLTRNIDSWVEEGRNYIKLIPKKTVDIVGITIELIDIEDEE
jgi:hypothetical protein